MPALQGRTEIKSACSVSVLYRRDVDDAIVRRLILDAKERVVPTT